ncbi:hypothetical protein TNCV_669721 [Trichonephila clavipes]|nr:hypothetical protein TNCV_669721 [Trichonephila clavipes]
MLNPDPFSRITLEAALTHPFFRPSTNQSAPISCTVVGALPIRRRQPIRGRSHSLKEATNEKVPSRRKAGRSGSLHFYHILLHILITNSCIPIGQTPNYSPVLIGREKLITNSCRLAVGLCSTS